MSRVPNPRTTSSGAVPDPQVDEDGLVERVRARSREARSLAVTWQQYAKNSLARAQIERAKGDHFVADFDADLLEVRAAVRAAAAQLLVSQEPAEAARLMMRNAAQHAVRGEPPLIGYDPVAIEYTIARTWQACALAVDPLLPEVQPLWT